MESHGEFFADKIMDLANIGVGAGLLGQALEGKLSLGVGLLGLSFFSFCTVVSYILRKRGTKKK